jgi:Ca-activated chloride channel family protein
MTRRTSGIVFILLAATVALGYAQQRPAEPRTINVDVDLVLINATVTMPNGQFVTALDKQNFQVWEDKVEQKIEYFSAEDVPLSVGIIFDASGSMTPYLGMARNAAVTFLRLGDRADEYFLVEFNDKAKITVPFTSDVTKLQNKLLFIPAKGSTALYDAIYLGMDTVRQGMHPKKALLVITDGEENHSRYSFSNVRDFVREQSVQIFAIGPDAPISALAEMTGGRSFDATFRDLEDICVKIGVELKNQYILGYRSTNETKDGRWRKVQLKVNPPRGLPKLNVRGKTGYFAPTVEIPATPAR